MFELVIFSYSLACALVSLLISTEYKQLWFLFCFIFNFPGLMVLVYYEHRKRAEEIRLVQCKRCRNSFPSADYLCPYCGADRPL